MSTSLMEVAVGISKKRASQLHARRRSAQRTGIVLTDGRQKKIVQMIQSGKATFVRKRSNRVSTFDVLYCGELMRVVYDRKRKCLVTVLDPPRNKCDVFKPSCVKRH